MNGWGVRREEEICDLSYGSKDWGICILIYKNNRTTVSEGTPGV